MEDKAIAKSVHVPQEHEGILDMLKHVKQRNDVETNVARGFPENKAQPGMFEFTRLETDRIGRRDRSRWIPLDIARLEELGHVRRRNPHRKACAAEVDRATMRHALLSMLHLSHATSGGAEGM